MLQLNRSEEYCLPFPTGIFTSASYTRCVKRYHNDPIKHSVIYFILRTKRSKVAFEKTIAICFIPWLAGCDEAVSVKFAEGNSG